MQWWMVGLDCPNSPKPSCKCGCHGAVTVLACAACQAAIAVTSVSSDRKDPATWHIATHVVPVDSVCMFCTISALSDLAIGELHKPHHDAMPSSHQDGAPDGDLCCVCAAVQPVAAIAVQTFAA